MSSAGNNNGGSNGDRSNPDDEVTPTVNVIGHRENRRMLSILANYWTEAKIHSARLEDLYVGLKEMKVPASPVWTGNLLNEFERHHTAEGENLVTLRAYLQAPMPVGVSQDDEEDDEDDDED
jgi:hypothetical protein